MLKSLLSTKVVDTKNQYQFGIRKEITFSGKETLIPIYRSKTKFGWTAWTQIVKIYDTYRTMDFDGETNLSEDECLIYIKEYKKVIESKYTDKLEKIEIFSIDEPEINNIDSEESVELQKVSIFKSIKNYFAQIFLV
jgi:hypothetical protein